MRSMVPASRSPAASAAMLRLAAAAVGVAGAVDDEPSVSCARVSRRLSSPSLPLPFPRVALRTKSVHALRRALTNSSKPSSGRAMEPGAGADMGRTKGVTGADRAARGVPGTGFSRARTGTRARKLNSSGCVGDGFHFSPVACGTWVAAARTSRPLRCRSTNFSKPYARG
jgi:hypothetical protein